MIRYFIPYALDKRFLDEIDGYMMLINSSDWAFLLDGDTAFLRPDWGQVISEYVARYPDTGLFTCYASRCHYGCQQYPGANMEADSILYHKSISDKVARANYGVKEINRRIAGHMMGIKKSTWMLIRNEVFYTAKDKKVLGVDTKISNAILSAGLKIRLMEDIYLFHYLRFKEGIDFTGHLL